MKSFLAACVLLAFVCIGFSNGHPLDNGIILLEEVPMDLPAHIRAFRSAGVMGVMGMGAEFAAPGQPLDQPQNDEVPVGAASDPEAALAPESGSKLVPQADPEFKAPQGGAPIYNAYFPMHFAGFAGVRNAEGGAGSHPGVMAIANSFSSGKGGQATSHATAYGNGKA